ncbi:MAG: hypothetical protein PUC32_07930 [Oscillospiraceae bacterium]|nr:hypothetical protein [Oscillospiraceae bacterium]
MRLLNHAKQKKGGFTTVEVIVVVVITMILAGVAVFGIGRWVNWTTFNRQNEAARTLFAAAQNQLTEYSENDQLAHLSKQLEEAGDSTQIVYSPGGSGPLLNVKNLDGTLYTEDSLWPNNPETDSDQKYKYEGDIYSITGTSERYRQYQQYKSGAIAERDMDMGVVVLYQMLEQYVYDPSLLNATICVEFAPADGQVFSVLYTDADDNTDFTYEDTNDTSGIVSISSREAWYRQNRMIGYYGVETLSKSMSNTKVQPILTDVHLENGDLLEMTFSVLEKNGVPKSAVSALNYNFTLYDREAEQDENALLMTFELNFEAHSPRNEANKTGIPSKVEVPKRGADGKIQRDENNKVLMEDLGTYNFLTWIDQDYRVHVVLDAADLGATSDKYDQAYLNPEEGSKVAAKKELSKTLSFHRFGLTADNIYYKVSGTPFLERPTTGNYKQTSTRASNTENAYFASQEQSKTVNNTGLQTEQKTTTYQLQNARHLYNLRFLEDYQPSGEEALSEDHQVVYQITRNIDWAAFTENGNFYVNGAEEGGQIDTTGAFPSIKQLRRYATLTGEKNNGKTYQIKGLRIDDKTNAEGEVYVDADERQREILPKEKPAGLFLKNNGTIQKLTLDSVSVTGGKNVGAFCSVNSGTLRELTVSDSDKDHLSIISGWENVGGIAGSCLFPEAEAGGEGTSSELTLQKLINRGQILERTAPTDQTRPDTEKAQNFGGILGVAATGEHQIISLESCENYGRLTALDPDTENLGGIVGKAKAGAGSIQLLDCNSSPQYDFVLDKNTDLSGYLKGKNVGGILGYNDGATLTGCNTKNEGAKDGFLFGSEHVGGIVGYNQGSASVISGGDGGSFGVNGLHVLGVRFVGGIVGENPSGTIKNWINQGFVGASEQYAGGITGSNKQGATIQNCTSNLLNSDTVRTLRQQQTFQGAYVGGIAGYNDGTITSDTPVTIVVNIKGKRFVGGVVGYNDQNAVITNYGVGSGFVDGENGAYVGGFAGVNTSPHLFQDDHGKGRTIRSNPNQVLGKACVGGTVGGNFLLAQNGQIIANFESDNFLGTLKAQSAIAGGFLGYNQVMAPKNDTTAEKLRSAIGQSAEKLEAADLQAFADPKALFQDVSACGTESNAVFLIEGVDAATETQANFGGITANLHVGGVVGFNENKTKLTLQNIVNKTPITASSAVTHDEGQPGGKDYKGNAFTYAYAGGMTGRVGENMTIINCRNQDGGDVVAEGTYTGGLCEVNAGTIQNCHVSSIGDNDTDYLGGITGVNKSTGKIEHCKIQNKTVTGGAYVGGIAAENYGTISGTTVENGTIRSHGQEMAGAIAGKNYGSGNITVSSNVNVTLQSDGVKAGGIVGANAGTMTAESGATVTGQVYGKAQVGGIVGDNVKGDLARFCNKANVLAAEGTVGGIAGQTSGNITNCQNFGAVEARGTDGHGGGIVAENNKKISSCQNYGTVDAKNGICGGITAQNNQGATIENCKVIGQETALTFSGKQELGGVAGINAGTISGTEIQNVTLQNTKDSTQKKRKMGGITGQNSGTISGCTVTEAALISNCTGVEMGGITGENQKSGFVQNNTVSAILRFSDESPANFGDLGGIVGKNLGNIQNSTFSGEVHGAGNDPQDPPQYDPNKDTETAVLYGYGGIAGVNEATVKGCHVKQASITAQGDANNIANVGGVCGVNGVSANISDITFGAEKTYSLKKSNTALNNNPQGSVYVGAATDSAYSHAGGVAGFNSGSITDIHGKDSAVLVENNRGHVGGIAGYNRRSGIIAAAETGSDWVVFAINDDQDNGCGGIVGYQASEYGLTDCTNRAKVVKTTTGSNGVGGMIGRMEVTTSSTYAIRNCKNYGNIVGNSRVGGMIGVWKYNGGNVVDCINYGTIEGESEGAAGIAACFYSVSSKVSITGCENHGTIKGNNGRAAGIMGHALHKAVDLNIQNCVNTGLISGNGIAGICAAPDGMVNGNSTIVGCRNYGYGNDMGGIVANDFTTEITVQDCYGLFNMTTTVDGKPAYTSIAKNKDNMQKQGENYYILPNAKAQSGNTFYLQSVSAPGIINPAYLPKLGTQTTGENAYFTSKYQKENSATYTIVLCKEVSLKSLTLEWKKGNNDKDQYYSYDLTCRSEDGTETFTESVTKQSTASTHKFDLNEAKKTKTIIISKIKAYTNNPGQNDANADGALAKLDLAAENETYVASDSYSQNGTTVTFNGPKAQESEEPVGDTAPSAGTPVQCVKLENGTYELQIVPEDEATAPTPVSLGGFSKNPYDEFKPNTAKTDEQLKVLGAGSNNIRYEVFQQDDAYFTVNGVDSQPTWIANSGIPVLDHTATEITAQWNKAQYSVNGGAGKDAPFYKVTIRYLDKGQKELTKITSTVYASQASFPYYQKYGGKDVQYVQVTVQGGVNYLQNGEVLQSWSPESTTGLEDISKWNDVLPTPQYHLEAVLKNSKIQYQVILENKAEYSAFLAKWNESNDPDLSLDDIEITVSVNGNEKKFTANAGKSSDDYDGVSDNATITAKAADPSGKLKASAVTQRETQMWSHDDITSGNAAKVYLASGDGESDIGFYGNTMNALRYQLKMNKDKHSAFYMHSELVAVDQSLGVPVAVSTADLQLSSAADTAIATKLSALPADLLDSSKYQDLSLRSYPSVMSNNIVYMGHTSSGSYTKEQLQSLYVTEGKTVSENVTGEKLIQDGKLANGFVIERVGQEQYTLSYNAILDYNASNAVTYDPMAQKTQNQNQVYYYDIDDGSLTKEQAPVVRLSYNDSADQLHVIWDEGDKAKNGAEHDYVLTGKKSQEGKETTAQIDSGKYTTTDGKNELILDGSTWNYDEITATISRRGTVEPATEKTLTFPATTISEPLKLKQRLSQIAKPSVSIHKENGEVQKNALIYDIQWKPLQQKERAYLTHDEVTIERAPDDEQGTKTYETAAALQTAWTALTAHYSEKMGAGAPDANAGNHLVYTWTETDHDVSVNKTMTLEKDSETRTISQSLKAVWTVDNTKTTQTVSLDDFVRGETLEASVRAIATGDQNYRNGPKGVEAKFTLPSRLSVPDVTALTVSPSYDENTSVTLEDLAKGLTLTMEQNAAGVSGKYQLAVAVYDEKPTTAGDTAKVIGSWNDGAAATLLEKDDTKAMMEGDLQRGTYTLKDLSGDYGGKYLKIAMRSVSDNAISPYWSDEDEAIDGTVNYAWLRIPRVQLATPDVTAGTDTRSYAVGDITFPVEHTALRFALTDWADQYRIQLVREKNTQQFDEDGTKQDYEIQYVDWIYLEKTTTGAYDVYYQSSDPDYTLVKAGDNAAPSSQQTSPKGYKLGTITVGQSVDLPYKVVTEIPEAPGQLTFQAQPAIKLETANNKATVVLQLPDTETVNNKSMGKNRYTSQIAVQSVSSDQAHYADSKIVSPYRQENGTFPSTFPVLAFYTSLADDNTYQINAQLVDSTHAENAYELTADSKDYSMVYEVTVPTGTNTEKQYYISTYSRFTDNNTKLKTFALLPKALLKDSQNQAVSISKVEAKQVAFIQPKKNLTYWSAANTAPFDQTRQISKKLEKIRQALEELQKHEAPTGESDL